jgi:hypothetical protein
MPKPHKVMPVDLNLRYPPSESPEEQAEEAPQYIDISPDVKEILEQHRRWIESAGKKGKPANLQEANLEKANLQKAGLARANLQEAKLVGANLQKAILVGANLQEADLTDVKNLTQAQLDQACVDDKTILPEGLKRPEPCPEEALSQK